MHIYYFQIERIYYDFNRLTISIRNENAYKYDGDNRVCEFVIYGRSRDF